MKPIGIISDNSSKIEETTNTNVNSTSQENVSVDPIIYERMLAHITNQNIHLTKEKTDEWNNKESVKGSKAKADLVRSELKAHTNDSIIHITKEERSKIFDKYTRSETDNKIAAASMGLIWQQPVKNTEEFKEKYSNLKSVKEGWFVPVNDEGIGYRYTAGKWVALKMFTHPLATEEIDGLITAKDYDKIRSIDYNANNYIHPSNENIRHVSDEQISSWDSKADNNLVTYYKSGLMSPEMLMKLEAIQFEGNQLVYRDTKVPITKYEPNTYTIGPEYTGADFIVNEDDSLHDVFAKLLNNVNARKIIILKDYKPYTTRKPIVINRNDIEIVSEPGVKITNSIHSDMSDKKSEQYVFDIKGSGVTLRDINVSSLGLIGPVERPWGNISVNGNNNKISNVTVEARNGIIVTGDNNIIENCHAKNCTYGLWIASGVNTPCYANSIVFSRATDCGMGIVISSSYTNAQYNKIENNHITNCKQGITIWSVAKGSTDIVPRYNIIAYNTIVRGNGDPKDYKDDEFTILINGQNNIFSNNLLRGKGLFGIVANNNTNSNYVC